MKIKRTIAILLLISILFSIPAYAVSSNVKQVLTIAKKQVGKPYRLASNAPSSFNCASFISYCFNSVRGGTIGKHGVNGSYRKIYSMSALKPGDIVCYRIGNKKGYGMLNYHFGIYTAKGYFVHASRSAGRVIVSKVRSYDGDFLGGMRVF